jgi:hypothetical protein
MKKKVEVTVSLFTEKEIPSGVVIKAKNSTYDYHSLFLMSINEGFMGSGVSIDDDRICQITIYEDGKPTICDVKKIFDNKEIIIDGLTNYITIIIPPSSGILFQLMPSFCI